MKSIIDYYTKHVTCWLTTKIFRFFGYISVYSHIGFFIDGLYTPWPGCTKWSPEGFNDKSVSWIPKYWWNIWFIGENNEFVGLNFVDMHPGLEYREPWLLPGKSPYITVVPNLFLVVTLFRFSKNVGDPQFFSLIKEIKRCTKCI